MKCGSLDAPSVSQLFTFGPRGNVLHLEGREWSQKSAKNRKPINSQLALGGRVMHSKGREWSLKIRKN